MCVDAANSYIITGVALVLDTVHYKSINTDSIYYSTSSDTDTDVKPAMHDHCGKEASPGFFFFYLHDHIFQLGN